MNFNTNKTRSITNMFSCFFYDLSLFSRENTYYVKGNFQNYNDNDSYNGYLIELNELTEID